MADLKVSGIQKFYGDVHAVRGVDLAIPDGEFAVLVGPSGCGKSTLLRVVAGLEEVNEGTVEIAGRVVNEVRPKDRDIAMVFQNYALYPYMSVFENIAFGLRVRKTPDAGGAPAGAGGDQASRHLRAPKAAPSPTFGGAAPAA